MARTFCGTRPPADSVCLCVGGLAARGGPENACAAAATRPKFIAGAAASLSTAVDDEDLDGGAGGGDVVDEARAALPARWKPAARAREVAGFARARWAACWVAGFARARWAAVKAAAAGIGDCMSAALSEVPPTRARRSGLDVKYLCACAVRLEW
jgi:hypothetical protein